MSNQRNTTRLPLRTTMTNKSKAHTLTDDLLERKARALEGSLNKLKLTTQQDKAKSTMETHRPVKQISRDKPAVKSTGTKQLIKCGQCEQDIARMRCLECVEVYCASCYSQFHLRGALQRHHSVLLPVSSKKNQIINTDINPGEANIQESGNENTNVASFQQSFLQWREDNANKSKRIQHRRGCTSPTPNRMDYSSKLPYLDLNASKSTTSDETFLSKKYRTTNQNNQQSLKKDQSKINVRVRVRHSFSDHTSSINIDPSNDDLSPTRMAESTEKLPVDESSSHVNQLAENEEQERPITHISRRSLSRPTSSFIKKDSRSNSAALPEQSLRSVLANKSTDELEAIIGSQLILSRPSSALSEKPNQPLSWRPEQSTSNNIDAQSVIIDQNTIAQFDAVLEDLYDESKIELAYQINSAKDPPSAFNSATTTPRRHSPFSFSNSLYKMSRINSAASRDTADGGFFTDVLPRQIIPSPPPPPVSAPVLPPASSPPPPILECSSSKEWKHTLENPPMESNSIALPKLSIPSLSRTTSKHEEKDSQSKTPIDNDSRPGSSLSSSSLPISVTSSKPGFDNTKAQSSSTSSRKSSSSTIDNSASSSSTTTVKTSPLTTTKDSSSSSPTTKTSSAPTSTSKDTTSTTSETSTSKDTTSAIATSETSTPKPTDENTASESEPTITKDEKVTSISDTDECLQESMNSLQDKTSSHEQASEDRNDSLKPTSTAYLTREVNITEKDLPIQKQTRRHIRRQTTASDEFSQYRKLEFSVGDGLKWQEASIESLSSTKTITSNSKQSSALPTPQSLSPKNFINTKLAEQFSKYDNDDGRSSRTYQNLNDDECFNQLRQELCSELENRGSDEDALLNEHLLKILQDVRHPFNTNDLPMIETKLRENESIHQPSLDNELLIHE